MRQGQRGAELRARQRRGQVFQLLEHDSSGAGFAPPGQSQHIQAIGVFSARGGCVVRPLAFVAEVFQRRVQCRLRHYRAGHVSEALWWWQFSYVSSWGNLAGAALNALLSVVSHDRLDVEVDLDADQVVLAERILADEV